MKTHAINKKARFDYEILKTYEAGLVLRGYEVKSIKTGHVSLKGAFVTVHKEELLLTNAHIPLYQFAGKMPNYEPERSRKLLVHKREIKNLIGKKKTEGLTLIPLSVYSKKGRIKLSFALAKGKKRYDKRQTIKERETNIKIDRVMKSVNS